MKNIAQTKCMFSNLDFARASGEAVLGTQRFFSKLMPTDL
jgi:hypothetical protein